MPLAAKDRGDLAGVAKGLLDPPPPQREGRELLEVVRLEGFDVRDRKVCRTGHLIGLALIVSTMSQALCRVTVSEGSVETLVGYRAVVAGVVGPREVAEG